MDLILSSKREFLKMVIFFENMHTTSEEIVTFLEEIIQTLKENNIRVVLETRTPFFMQKLNQAQVSKKHFEHIKKFADSEFEIAPFQRKNSVQLIKNHFDLIPQACDNLAEILCDNPLEIHNAIKLLENQNWKFEKYVNILSSEDQKKYWEKLGIKRSSTTMALLNNLKSISCFSQIFEIAVISKGTISREIVELFFREKSDDVQNACVDSTIFDRKNGTLICRHLRYLEAMREISDENLRYKTAEYLLPYVREHKQADEYYLLIELEIQYIIGDSKEILHTMENVRDILMKMHQYRDALTELLRYINFIENTSEVPLELLLSALDCIRELHEENNDDYEFIYGLVKDNIYLKYINFKESKFWYKYQLMIWHKNFVTGNLKKAFDLSKQLYDSLEKAVNLFEIEEDYPGQVYNAYGLSLKMCSNGENAELIFQEGVNRYPHSYYVQAALLSQEGNQLLKHNPDKAAEKYQKLIEVVKNKQYPYQEVIHTKIDIAMSFFLSGKFYQSKLWAQKSIEEASSLNMYSQKGRAENICGCCLAADKQFETSIEKFNESIYLLELSKSELYLWRAQLNLASVLLFQSKNKDEAKQLLFKVIDTLTNKFEKKIIRDKQSVPYQSMLLIFLYLHELEEFQLLNDLKIRFKDTNLITDFSKLLDKKDWRSQFRTKVICYSGIVLVTG